ncbi:alpha/beta hydrolase [Paenibacillus sp. N4]|uniref:alpha/beta hydrolase family protein n=1 Tax=Paenibacillus vietnamensis TaxID=2590547 RepID=UPI001CD18960|nr:alpha/beta hydrolase [Paenibacillus vietnamensis]MCA0754565.1 alpha/beta hydrolase [Paenibacillus vietnamensis]
MEIERLETGQLQPPRSRLSMAKEWLIGRFRVRKQQDTFVWRAASGGAALSGVLSMAVAALGIPTGFGTGTDLIVFTALNLAAMQLASLLLSVIFSLLYIPLPRRFVSVLLYAGTETYLILHFAEFGLMLSIAISAGFTVAFALVGGAIGLFARLRMSTAGKWLTGTLIAAVCASQLFLNDWTAPAKVPHREAAGVVDTGGINGHEEQIPDPSRQGSQGVRAFTYGSGEDKHRALFGENVDIKTGSVDASSYITKWSKLKTYFWGFDQSRLPLNGRVWMPDKEGVYPLALIVHGNHLMEHFSDGGYGYLGELLASQGIIAVSVDENFLNYSVWSGIPDHDMKTRAWVLLKHLQQIQQLSGQEGNPFSGRVDMDRVALIGHSRGGQAVAMAADADRWFKKDPTLGSLSHVRIQAVAAIAPTDKKVDSLSAQLKDVHYLTIQGARDADVNNFYGDRQYNRVDFSADSGKFKAELYIEDANHSQFNTEWGRMDERPPGGLFLNRNELLEEEDQRQISKVYISAFLQTALLGEKEYEPLFRDYRNGLAWLPVTGYMNRYEEAGFAEIARYEHYGGKTMLEGGGKASAAGMDKWQVDFAKDRDGNSKGTKGIELSWTHPGAAYSLALSPSAAAGQSSAQDPVLAFSMANLERDLLAKQDKAESESGAATLMLPPLPKLEVELTLQDGRKRAIELDKVMPVPSSAYTSFMSWSWLEKRMKDGKYKQANEPVFQTYLLPIADFAAEGGELSLKEISRITFRFTSGPGKVMLDDIGFMPG